MGSEYKFVKLRICKNRTHQREKEGKGEEGEKREKAESREGTRAGRQKKEGKQEERGVWRGTHLNACLPCLGSLQRKADHMALPLTIGDCSGLVLVKGSRPPNWLTAPEGAWHEVFYCGILSG